MYLDKPIPLRAAGRRGRKRGPGPSRASGLLVVLILLGVNYLLFFAGDDVQPPGIDERMRSVDPTRVAATIDPDGLPPSIFEETAELDDFGEPIGRVVTGKLRRGQTVLNALRGEGIDQQSALPLVNAMQEVFDFTRAQVGDSFTARLNDEGVVTSFSYTQSPIDIYEVARDEDGQYLARKKQVPTRVDVAHIGCAIRSSLYESLARCGEGVQLAGQIIDLFAWDVDFFQDVRDGDEIRVIVEKVSVDGRFLNYGKVLAAEYSGKFSSHRIVAYRDPNGQEGYFTPDGQSVRKDFLRSPLKYTRMSAGASGTVRRGVRTAAPVIYSATERTPVWAVGAGTVAFAGDNGNLGKTVTIRHEDGFTSTYAHLGTISRGIQQGAFVSQKTVIGQVGQTGSADSPQLLYSLRRNGQLVDPMTTRFAEGDPVSPEHRGHFEREVEQVLQDLLSTPVSGVQDRRG